VAPGSHPVNVADLTAQLQTFHNIHLGLLVWQLEDSRNVRSLRLLDLNRAPSGSWERPYAGPSGKLSSKRFPLS
jgi:hypothetical protein